MRLNTIARCPECGRYFDLLDERDAAEWYYGHDCEPIDLSAIVVRADEAFDPAAGFGAPSLKPERSNS